MEIENERHRTPVMLDCKYNVLGQALRGTKIQGVFAVVFVLGFQVRAWGVPPAQG